MFILPSKRPSTSKQPLKLYKSQVSRPKNYISPISSVIDLKMASVLISQASTAARHLGAVPHQPEGTHIPEGTKKNKPHRAGHRSYISSRYQDRKSYTTHMLDVIGIKRTLRFISHVSKAVWHFETSTRVCIGLQKNHRHESNARIQLTSQLPGFFCLTATPSCCKLLFIHTMSCPIAGPRWTRSSKHVRPSLTIQIKRPCFEVHRFC